jgi:hypothetical protein
MGTAFLANKSDSFKMKLFHFVSETRLKDWLLISILPIHFLFQNAVSCGECQLIGQETRVANLGIFLLKTLFKDL